MFFVEEVDKLCWVLFEVVEMIVVVDIVLVMVLCVYGGYEVDWMIYIEVVS